MLQKLFSRKKTIYSKILFPVMMIIVIQTLFYTLLLYKGGLIENIVENTFDIFNEKTLNRSIYIESSMQNFTNIKETEQTVLHKISTLLELQNKTYSDIAKDPELNKCLIQETAEDILSMLRYTSATGAFLILDGVAHSDLNNSRAGFYIRDLDPTSYAAENADLLLERGSSTISKKYRISLDSYWESYFLFSNSKKQANELFYSQPLNQAKKAALEGDNISESGNFGYWSNLFSLSDYDGKVITYSIPLISKTGEIIGVIGIDLSERYLLSMLKPEKQTSAQTLTAYLLGILDEEGVLHPVCANGSLYTTAFRQDSTTLSPDFDEDYNIYQFYSNTDLIYGSIQKLSLYNQNTPFENQQWVVVSFMQEADMMSFPNQIQMLTWILSLFSIALGAIAVVLSGRLISKPIVKMAQKVRISSTNDYISFDQINILEIDELTTAIETLNNKVVESKTKVPRIIEMLHLPIGVFEYELENDTVFCSKNLYAILDWDEKKEKDDYMPKAEFEERMKSFPDYLEGNKTYSLRNSKDEVTWIRTTSLKEEKQCIVAVMDVTKETIEKQKILYERDYDSLTDIQNRRAFVQEMITLFFEKKDIIKTAIMLTWDLDNLKYVNDTFGHDIGDAYIKKFADCIKGFLNYNALIARRSGDEFFTFLYGYSSKEEITKILDTVWNKILETGILLVDGIFVKIRVSGGYAWYPHDSSDYEELFRYSDFAMYNAKHSTKGCLKEFNKINYIENAILVNGPELLNQILENNLIHFAFQPIIEISSATIYGYEMLMRSLLSELSSPMNILKIARSQSKLYILERTTFFGCMEQFTLQIQNNQIEPSKKVFINSIASACMTAEEIDRFTEQFKDYLSCMVIEFTEEDEVDIAYRDVKLAMVKQWNCLYAIDDYGSGYNSEALLLNLNPDIIKVDMSIIRNIDQDKKRQQMFRNIVRLAHRSQIKVLAEGVETKAEMEMVISLGTDLIQGYYSGKPDFTVQELDPQIASEIHSAYQLKRKSFFK